MAFSSRILRRVDIGIILEMTATKVYQIQFPKKIPYHKAKSESVSFVMISPNVNVALKDDISACFYLGGKVVKR